MTTNLPNELISTSKDILLPALDFLGNTITSLTQNQLVPALAGAAISLDAFGRETLIPGLEEAGKFAKDKLDDLLPVVEKAGEYAKENAGPAMEKVGEYVKENPGKSALWAASGLTVLVPGLVSAPVLWAFGWGSTGVRVGESFYFYVPSLRFLWMRSPPMYGSELYCRLECHL